ncbi:SdrD B-like domain-containing protein, partial [Larkinella sp. VNQ87]|uniref:SdrD B-like domain-containing protein n=1 Tax=Larkinella sp. VNQ87 TaxID=3400921 RepID=UPI003C04571B
MTLVQVAGRVFNDLNYNGNDQNNADPGLAGAYLVLQNAAGQCIATTQTAADGSYCFPGLMPNSGAYTIYETVANPGSTCPPVTFTQPASYDLSTTPRTRSVTVLAANLTDQDFGHAPCRAQVNNNSPVCAGQTLTLSGSGSGSIYSWTGPNGFTATGQLVSIPNATTAHTGSYTLTVTGNTGCTATGTTDVVVTEQAAAASTSPVCEGQTLFLNASGDNAAMYLWTGPNGFSSTAKAPVIQNVTLSAAGTYTVVVTSAAGCSGTGTTQVLINAKPDVTITGVTTVCNGQTTTLNATGVGLTTYQWNTGAQTASITITPGVSFTYTVMVTNAAGCSNSAATPVTVNTCQEICDDGIDNDGDGLTDSDDPDCLCNTNATGTRVYTVAPVPGATSYNWVITKQGGADFSSAIVAGQGTNSIEVDLDALNANGGLGSYDICVVCNSTTCGTTPPTCKVLTIRPCCDLGVNVLIASTTLCTGSDLELTAEAVDAQTLANVTYRWTGPNSFTSDQATVSIPNATTAHAGSYTVVATEVTNGQSCTATNVVDITIETPSTVGEDKLVSICNNETIDLATLFPAGGSFSALSGSMTGTVFSGIDSGVGSFTVVYTADSTVACPGGQSQAVIIVRNCTPLACNYPISSTVIDATCGNSDGIASLIIGGLPTGATTGFAWSNGSTGPRVTGLAAGIYSVTATISITTGVCTVIDTVQVNDIGGPKAEVNLITAADCRGANGAVSIDITPATPTDPGPFLIQWSGAAMGSQNNAQIGVNTIPNLPAGAYEFIITSTSTNTTCSSHLSINIPKDDSDQISLTATPTNATACGTFTGNIVVTVTPAVGVTGPYSYSLNGIEVGVSSLTSFTISNLKAGVYTVGVSSSLGCTAANQPVTIQETGATPVTGWTAVNPNCPTDKGMLVFAGGQPTTSFEVREVTSGAVVQTGINGANPTSLTLAGGSYAITQLPVSTSCTSSTILTITVPAGLQFNVQYTKVTCAPGGVANTDGTISVIQIRGGTEPHSTTVTNAQNQVMTATSVGIYENLAAGVYKVQIYDANGCSGSESLFVTVPNCTQICPDYQISTHVVDPNCGTSDGRAVAQLGEFTEDEVDYLWSNGYSGINANGLSSGVYSVTATILTGTFTGCVYEKTVNVNDIGGPVFEKRTINPSSCAGSTGSVSFSIVSGDGPYVLSWTGPTTSSVSIPNTTPGFARTISGLAAGNYIFTLVSTGSTCKSTQDVTIPVSSSGVLNLTATPVLATSCGAQDGQINLTVTPTASYVFTVNGAVYTSATAGSFPITNLPAGIYTVAASATNGCTAERTVIVGETGAPAVTGWTSQSATCPTDNGTLVFAGGQAASVTYRVLVGAGGTVVATVQGDAPNTVDVPKGVYYIERTETIGSNVCTSIQSFTVAGPNGMDFNIQYTPESCGPGGTGNGDGSLSIIQINGGTPNYNVQLTKLTTGAVVAGTGTAFSNLAGGDYKIDVTDSRGCPANDGALVTVPPCQQKCPPLAFNKVVTDNKCGEVIGSAEATLLNVPAGGVVTYLWSNGQNGQTATALTSGVYAVTATIALDNTIYAGCMYVDTVNVNDVGGPIATPITTTGASCTSANGSVVLNIQPAPGQTGGPFTIAYTGPTTGSLPAPNPGPFNVPNLKAGSYVFTVTDAITSCKSVVDVIVPTRTPNGFNLTVVPKNVSACGAQDGNLKITVSGGVPGYVYRINGYIEGTSTQPTFTRAGLPAGIYTVEVTDGNGCVVRRENVLINETGSTPVAGWTKTDALCPDNTGALQFAGNGLSTDEYVVTISGTATEIGRTPGDTPITFTVQGGTYLITKTTSTSCTSQTTITVNQPNGFDFNIQPTQPTCLSLGGLMVVQPSGGTTPYSYTIAGPTGVVSSSVATGLMAGSYTVTVGDSRGCQFSKVQVLTTGSNLTVTASATPAIVCVGQTISLSATVPTSSTGLTFAWSGPDGFTGSGQTTTTVATSSGSYTVTVTDPAGCTAWASTTVTVGATPTVAATPSTVCVGETVTLNTTAGGTSYAWRGPNFSTVTTVPTVSILNAQLTDAGIYSVTITGGNGCTGVGSTTVTVNAPPSVTALASSQTVCVGGSLVLTAATSPVGSYTYTWSGPNGFVGTGAIVTISNALQTHSGSYSVVVTNANGCSASAVTTQPVTVTICCQDFTLDKIVFNANCGQANGEATVTANGGTPDYTYLWSNGSTGSHVTGLLAGSYTVTVSDAVGCSSSLVVDVSNVEGPQLTVVSSGSATCLAADGVASVTATGGDGALRYVWNTGATGATLSGVVAGVYSVTVTDGKGCIDIEEVTIDRSPGSLTMVVASTPSTCGQATGTVSVTASGSSGYRYLWNTGVTTSNLNTLVAGVYSVTVVDGNGCSVNGSVTVEDATGPQVIANATAVLCSGGSTGMASVTATGGTGVLSYLWSTGATTTSVSSLAAGEYTVWVRDVTGCVGVDTVVVTEPEPLDIRLSPSVIACGSTTGDIVLVSSQGGIGPHRYTWSNGSTSGSLLAVQAGPYSLTVTDAVGCTVTGSTTLDLPVDCCEERTIDLAGVNPQCGQSNGTITAILSGTVSPGTTQTIVWRNLTTGSVVATNTTLATGLPAGSYSVSLTLTNGSVVCSYSAVTSLSDVGSASIVVASTTPSGCAVNNGTATLQITGAPSFTVSYAGASTGSVVSATGAVSLTGLAAGQYSVTVRDASGCTSTEDFVIEPAGAVSLQPVAVATPASCTGVDGSVTVTWTALAGVSSYSVTVGSQSTVVTGTNATFNGLAGGSYAVSVSVAGNVTCGISTTSVTVPVTGGPALAVTTLQPLCSEDLGVISVVNPVVGVTYSLYALGGAQLQSGNSYTVSSGDYEVRAVSATGCISSTVVSLTQPQGLVFNVSVTNGECGQPGSLTVDNLNPPNLTARVFGAGGEVGNLTSLLAGSYTVVVSDANGCTASQVVSVTTGTGAPVLSIIATNANCGQANGEITVTASPAGNYTYLWSNGSTGSRVTGLLANSYTVVVTDAAGCQSSTVVAISNVEGPQLTVVSSGSATCLAADGVASVTATGGDGVLRYVWSTGATGTTLSGVVAGIYSVTVTDNKGCIDIEEVTIGTSPGSLTAVVASTNSACGQATGSVSVTASGSSGYRYLWNTGATTNSLNNQVAGVYSVTVTDANGCWVADSETINDIGGPSITASVTAVQCGGGATGIASVVVTGGTPTYTYLWSNGMTTSSIDNLVAGTYTVDVTDANGCVSSTAVSVTQPAGLSVELSPSTLVCGSTTGDIVMTSIVGGTSPYRYLWSNGMTSSSLLAVATGAYSLTVTDDNGCVATGQAPLEAPDCCVVPALTVTGPVCDTATGTYSVGFSTSAGSSVTATAGVLNLTTNRITDITLGTSVTVVASNGCGVTREIVTGPVSCPTTRECNSIALSVGQGVCVDGVTYIASVTVSGGASLTVLGATSFSNGVITAAVGTNVTVLAGLSGCETKRQELVSPASCTV